MLPLFRPGVTCCFDSILHNSWRCRYAVRHHQRLFLTVSCNRVLTSRTSAVPSCLEVKKYVHLHARQATLTLISRLHTSHHQFASPTTSSTVGISHWDVTPDLDNGIRNRSRKLHGNAKEGRLLRERLECSDRRKQQIETTLVFQTLPRYSVMAV